MHQALQTFAEKVDRLEKSELRKFMISGWTLQSKKLGDNAKIPEIEHLEAYILNLRFFIQNNEPTSLENIASLYEQECKDLVSIDRFKQIRDSINRELDKNTWFKFNNQTVTYRKIFEGMIYSEFAHSNKDKYPQLQEMLCHPFTEMLAMDTFLRCIDLIHRCLVQMKQLNTSAFNS